VYEGTEIPLRTSVYDTFSPAEFQQLKQYKTHLETQNATLLARLAELEAESEAIAAEEREVDEEDARLAEEEREFLIEYQQVEQDIHGYEAQLATEKTLHLLATQTLQRLESANVYNDVFQIGHVPLNPGRSSSTAAGQAGHTGQTVGTINGLRLGGRPVVEWAEINAALGLVALCIDRMAVKVGCTFATYVLTSRLVGKHADACR
jgi:beclin 1